jgi:recombination protein RecT
MTQIAEPIEKKEEGQNGQPLPVQQPQPQLPAEGRTVADAVLAKIGQFQSTGSLRIPKEYSPENSLRAAWLILQEVEDLGKNKALTVCTRESIANALFNMVVQGLNPVKKQCYFIVRGNKLCMERSYMGTIAIAKRDAGVKDANANVVYKGDDFAYEINTVTGRKHVTKHVQQLENIDPANIIGAYVTVVPNEGEPFSEIMTFNQIKTAWAQGSAKGNSPAHQRFPDQMAMKTVTSRGLKIAIGSSSDSGLFDEEEEPQPDVFTAHVQHEIKSNANQGPEMSFDAQEGSPAAQRPGSTQTEGIVAPEHSTATTPTQNQPEQKVAANDSPNEPPF